MGDVQGFSSQSGNCISLILAHLNEIKTNITMHYASKCDFRKFPESAQYRKSKTVVITTV